MKKELGVEELTKVAGGNAYINENTYKMCFDSFDEVYKFSVSPSKIKEVCDGFIGQYATIEEYDTACRNELFNKGWITEIK